MTFLHSVHLLSSFESVILLFGPIFNKEPFNDLDELLKESIMMVDELYEDSNYEILPLKERVILKKENAE